MKNFKRAVHLAEDLKKNKVIVIYGPRQVGKTTLVKNFMNHFGQESLYYTGDDLEIADILSSCRLSTFSRIFAKTKLLIIDEAQKIENIGRAIKLIVDNLPTKVILTGSSSFDLANKTGEALTGRKVIRTLYPLSFQELQNTFSGLEMEQKLEELLIYGSYPAVLNAETYQDKEEKVKEITNSYLLKDILEFRLVKNSSTIRDLLKLLAFQIGSEVSYNELASKLTIDKKTVIRYLDLLEKSFVIFKVGGFSRNLRKEVYKSQKYFFYDLGIRNSIIANFNSLNLRNDVGQLWENFLFIERIKRNTYNKVYPNYYFWRTYDQKEIDMIEEYKGHLSAYEFKINNCHAPEPKEFLETYENSSFATICKENYYDFID